jgi:hypothetical protein
VKTKRRPRKDDSERSLKESDGRSTIQRSPLPSLVLPRHLIGGLLILATFLFCIFPLMDTDFWWHLRTGQLIWERASVPRFDWYLFTDSDRPWIDLHWGFQLLLAAIYALGGINLVIVVKAAVISTAVGICWFATGHDLPDWVRTLVWIPAVICITGRAYERPEMLSQLFLAMWLWIAFHADRQPRWLWALPAIQLIWVNCHSLYVLGLVVGGFFALDWIVRSSVPGRLGLVPPSSTPSRWSLMASGGACALAAFINPYFLSGALFPLVLHRKFSAEREIYASIGEFQRPIDFFLQLKHGYENVYLDSQIVLLLATFASLFALAVASRRWSPFRWLLCLGFANLAWEATRNVNIFALVSATVLAANMADLWRIWFPGERGQESRRDGDNERKGVTENQPLSNSLSLRLSSSSTSLGNLVIGTLLIAWMILTVTGVWGQWTGERRSFGWGEKPFWFAHKAVQFAGQPGSPDRAFIAHIGIAATYEFHHGPIKKVFLDPRLEVATPQTFQAHEAILKQMSIGDRRWELLLRDSQGSFPVVILDSRNSRPSISGLYSTPGWRLVYADPAAAVFLTEEQAKELKLGPADPSPLLYPP